MCEQIPLLPRLVVSLSGCGSVGRFLKTLLGCLPAAPAADMRSGREWVLTVASPRGVCVTSSSPRTPGITLVPILGLCMVL